MKSCPDYLPEGLLENEESWTALSQIIMTSVNIAVLTGVKVGVWGFHPHAGGKPPVFYSIENRYNHGTQTATFLYIPLTYSDYPMNQQQSYESYGNATRTGL
jgi:hypothetical protein